MKYILFFIISFLIIYLVYFLLIVSPFIRELKPKKKKKKKKNRTKKLPTDILIFTSYYGIDYNKVGLIRMLRVLNFVNALIMSILVTAILPIKKIWLQILLLAILILPIIWVAYMLVAKYFKYLERKSENV